MTLKYKIGLGLLAAALLFAAGRYSVPAATTKLTETKSVDTKVEDDRQIHTQTKTVTVEKPTGEKVTTTTINTDTVDEKQTQQDVTEKLKQTTTTSKSKINVSALYVIPFSQIQPVYGVSVQKELLGPVTVGGFYLTNGTVGVTMGIDF